MKQVRWLALCLAAGLFLCGTHALSKESFILHSPDGATEIRIDVAEKITYAFNYKKESIVTASPISLTLANGEVLGRKPTIVHHQVKTVEETIEPLYGIRSNIPDYYRELRIDFAEKYALEFRAYDDGWGYRFVTEHEGEITVLREGAVSTWRAITPCMLPFRKKPNRGSRVMKNTTQK